MKKILLIAYLLYASYGVFSQSGYTCATARVIPSLPYSDTYSTCGAGNDISTGTCDNTYSGGEDVVYKLTISNAPITLSFALNSGTSVVYPSILVSTSCTFNPCIADLTGSTSAGGNVTFSTNGTYYIKIDNWPTPNCISYTLTIDPPPPNDLICNASKLIVNNACVSNNNTMATTTAASDNKASCISASNSLWYYFDATKDSITVTSSNSYLYGEMAVFSSSDNTCTGTLTQLNCLSQTTVNKVEFKLTGLVPGKRYFVMIDGWSTYTGSSCVSVTETPPPPPIFGSSCGYARELFPRTGCGPDPTSQTNPNDNMGNVLNTTVLNSTTSVPPSTCDFSESFLDASVAAFKTGNNCAGTSKKASWVKFTATAASTTLKNNGTGSNADLCYTLYSGDCSNLSLIGCYTVAKGGSQVITTTAGTVYYIQITAGNSNVNPNQHWLCITSTANTPANPIDFCANAYNVSDGIPVGANNAMATQDGNAYMCAGTTSVPNNNVWFKWTCPASWPAGSSAFVHVYNQNCNLKDGVQIDVYGATVNCGNVASGTPPCVAYTNPQNNESFYASWVPAIGSTYYITIDGSCGAVCSFMLQINNTAALALPIKLLSFNAVKSAASVDIFWEVASEVNNDKYLLERSTNGVDFEVIGTLKGRGTTASYSKYTFVDNSPAPGINYYRLKQVDFSGAFSYSQLVSLKVSTPRVQLKDLHPNPVGKSLSYVLSVPDNSSSVIEIVDLSGRVVIKEEKNLPPGEQTVELDLSNLNEGIYFLKVTQSGFNDFMKFVKSNK